MKRDELERRIAEFPQWHYAFEFDDGVRTPALHAGVVNRQEQRRRYFFGNLIHLYGGSLSGCRVLDLGCNAGFWSLNAIDAGADFVLGVDADQGFVDQANLVFEAKGVDPARYGFEQGNVFQWKPPERFDVVLCLALMDQVAKPVELFELMASTGAEIIVIETELSRASAGFFEIAKLGNPRKAVDRKIALIPSRAAITELAAEFGYETLALARNITDYTGMGDYRNRRRLAFLCSSGRSLAALPEEASSHRPWWLRQLELAREHRSRRG